MKKWSKYAVFAILLLSTGPAAAMPPAYKVPATAPSVAAVTAPLDATDQSELDRASLRGKELWFGSQCAFCHMDYVSFARTDYARFRVVHEPEGRDMVPSSIEAILLHRYKDQFSASDYRTVATWVTAWKRQLDLRTKAYQNVRSLAPGGSTAPGPAEPKKP